MSVNISHTDTDTPADFGLPPAPAPAPALPIALARIVGLGAWWPCRDRPGVEHREAIIEAVCPFGCGWLTHTHHWRLGDPERTEVRWAPCGAGGHYQISLDLNARHAVDPETPITRRARK